MFWTSSQFIGRGTARDAGVLADIAASCAGNDAKAVQDTATKEQIVAARSGRVRCIVETRREENVRLEAWPGALAVAWGITPRRASHATGGPVAKRTAAVHAPCEPLS